MCLVCVLVYTRIPRLPSLPSHTTHRNDLTNPNQLLTQPRNLTAHDIRPDTAEPCFSFGVRSR